MELLNLPRLRNKELQTVGEQSIRICGNIAEVQTALDKAKASLETFRQGMQKDKSSGISKAEIDQERDRFTYGLLQSIKAETYYNHQEEATAQLVTRLATIAGKYTGITRFPLNEQTAAIDNLLDEINKLKMPADALPAIQRWLPLMEAANSRFKTASNAIIEDSARQAEISAAGLVAPQLTEDLQNLYSLMFAHARIGSNNATVEAYKELEILINSVN
ncbi:DUF6261 family protein [Carboxylicivirga taeanensis]|uniref:DUF6261 family protein n=1 Tax=Carboxylicivirga taeanensis TaxID=1416875 RepID=UPI003F6DED9B